MKFPGFFCDKKWSFGNIFYGGSKGNCGKIWLEKGYLNSMMLGSWGMMEDEMRIGICDDEAAVRHELCRMLKQYNNTITLCQYVSGEDCLREQNLPDILFLDIKMSGIDGMQVARTLRQRGKKVLLIFVTADESMVFDAFDVAALHYLVKPIQKEKLYAVMELALKALGKEQLQEQEQSILVKSGNVKRTIYQKDIMYVEVLNRILTIHTLSEDIDCYGRLRDFQTQLGMDFFRSHRSYLVNLRHVNKYNASTIYLTKGQVPVSKKQYPVFVHSYMKYLKKEML